METIIPYLLMTLERPPSGDTSEIYLESRYAPQEIREAIQVLAKTDKP